MSNIHDLIFDYSKNNIGKITYEIIKSTCYFNKSINIYNSISSIPLQKYWIHIKKCKIIKISEFKITIALSNQDTDLINFFNEIREKIVEQIQNDKNDNTSIMFVDNFHYKPNFAPIVELSFNQNTMIYDQHDQILNSPIKISVNDYEILIELSNVQINGKQMIPQWTIIQMKMLETYDLKKSIFSQLNKKNFESVAPNITNIPNIPIPPPMPFISKNVISKNETNENTNHKIRFVPSPNDLVNAMNRLKKIEQNKDNLESDNILESIKLKKVITKEPISITQMLKNEYDQNHVLNDVNIVPNTYFKIDNVEKLREKIKMIKKNVKKKKKEIKKIRKYFKKCS